MACCLCLDGLHWVFFQIQAVDRVCRPIRTEAIAGISQKEEKEEWKGQLLFRIYKALKGCQLRNELCCCPIIHPPSLVHWLPGIHELRERNDSRAEIWKPTFRTVCQILILNVLRFIPFQFLEASLCVLCAGFKCFFF